MNQCIVINYIRYPKPDQQRQRYLDIYEIYRRRDLVDIVQLD